MSRQQQPERSARSKCLDEVNSKIYGDCSKEGDTCEIQKHCTAQGKAFDAKKMMDREHRYADKSEGTRCAKKFVGSSEKYGKLFDVCPPAPQFQKPAAGTNKKTLKKTIRKTIKKTSPTIKASPAVKKTIKKTIKSPVAATNKVKSQQSIKKSPPAAAALKAVTKRNSVVKKSPAKAATRRGFFGF